MSLSLLKFKAPIKILLRAYLIWPVGVGESQFRNPDGVTIRRIQGIQNCHVIQVPVVHPHIKPANKTPICNRPCLILREAVYINDINE